MQDDGSSGQFPAMYMAVDPVAEPFDTFTRAICGHKGYGDVTNGLIESVICGPRSVSGLADLRGFFGIHFLRDECYYVGLSLIAAAPTGSHITGTYFFEPVVGNSRHWECGLGFDGRVLAWEADGTSSLSLYGSIRATHMFRTCHRRAFDFCANGFASRYLLLKEFDEDRQYTGTLLPASTVTTQPCQVWVGGQFDIVAMLGYLSCGLEIDFGYNAWIRTREHVTICGEIARNRYGIKGIQNVVDELGNPDNLTQSRATIFGSYLDPETQVATADPDSPVFISTDDLDPKSAASTAAFTHKFFGHVGYTWDEFCHVSPY